MKDTQTTPVEGLDGLPEFNNLISRLGDIMNELDEFSKRIPDGHSFAILCTVVHTQDDSDTMRNRCARISGGKEKALCLVACAQKIKHNNVELFI